MSESAPPEGGEAPPVDPVDELAPSFGRDVEPIFQPGREPVTGLGVPTWKLVLAGGTLLGLVAAGLAGPARVLGLAEELAPPPAIPAARPAPAVAVRPGLVHVEPFVDASFDPTRAHLSRALADGAALALKRRGAAVSLDERLRTNAPLGAQAERRTDEPELRAELRRTTGADWWLTGRWERRGEELAVTATLRPLGAPGDGLTLTIVRPVALDDELPDALGAAVGLLAPALVAPGEP